MTNDLWYGTTGPRDAKIMVVGEAWGARELDHREAFVGESGQELNRMLAEAFISRDEVFCTNIIADKPPSNELFRWFTPTKDANKGASVNGLYPSQRILEGLGRLAAQVEAVKPKVIVAAGNYPLWAFSSRASISNSSDPSGWKIPSGIGHYRGSMLWTDGGAITLSQRLPLLPIFHPAGILRNWEYRAPTVHDLRTRIPLALSGRWDRPAVSRVPLTDFQEASRWLEAYRLVADAGPLDLASDIETWKGTITCIGFSTDGRAAVSIPFLRPTPDGMRDWWPEAQEKVLVHLLRRLLMHPNVNLIGQNWIYDAQYLWRWWRVPPRVSWDTMLVQHVLFPGTPKALWYLASLYCDWYQFWKDDAKEWREKALDLETHLIYNCDDCLYTWQIAAAQRRVLKQLGREPQWDYMKQTWSLAFDLMDRGVKIDQQVRLAMTMEVAEAARIRQQWLDKVVPADILPPTSSKTPWYQSPAQTMRFLYDTLGLRTVVSKKTGNRTSDDAALHELIGRYPYLSKILNTVLELRSLGVFQNNFLSASIDADGRMRTAFNPGGTETFRWSSSENAFGKGTNFQNIPKGGELK